MSIILPLDLILEQNILLLSLTDNCVDKIDVIKNLGYHIAGKIGGELNLAVCLATAKLKSTNILYLYIIRMVISYTEPPYLNLHANILAMAI